MIYIIYMYVFADHSLFINCGGEATSVDGNDYEEDLSNSGPSTFLSSANKWAYSSTGVFLGNEGAPYTTRTSLTVNGSEFYKTARIAPQSLKYYGLCLLQGNYKVQLHFAEIMFSDNQTFDGLGRRLFDVSIQVCINITLFKDPFSCNSDLEVL